MAARVLTLGLALASAAAALPTPRGALAAALLCQTSYRLDDELAADEAGGGPGTPRATARLRELLRRSFGEEAARRAVLFRARKLDLLAYGFEVPGLVFVVYRGSRGPREAAPGRVTNWALNHVAGARGDVAGFAPAAVHPGYAHASRALQPAIDIWLRGRAPDASLVVTGHSLGAAMATYAAFHLAGSQPRPGALVTFGAPAAAYGGCGPGRAFADAFRERAPAWEATTYAFTDDAAPWLLRAACPGATRIGQAVDLGLSPAERRPIEPGDVAPGDPARSPGARVAAAATRWMYLDTHYAFHYTRALAGRYARAAGLPFEPEDFRAFYGLPRPLSLTDS